MATIRESISHEERTAQEPRESRLEPVTLSRIENVNSTIRLLRLSALNNSRALKSLPGQWLDVFIPGLTRAGGFTITSTPKEGQPSPNGPGYFELAIQRSENPPAKWLWKPEDEILNSQLIVRPGGSFVWPPLLDASKIDQVVLIAGGVGINPLISIFSALMRLPQRPKSIRFVYGTKAEPGQISASRILFLTRLTNLIRENDDSRVRLDLFLTGASQENIDKAKGLPEHVKLGRIGKDDLEEALGDDRKLRQRTVCYVCGPPVMTDEFVGFLSTRDGMEEKRVLCEKWW